VFSHEQSQVGPFSPSLTHLSLDIATLTRNNGKMERSKARASLCDVNHELDRNRNSHYSSVLYSMNSLSI
jgi:hypothetical protein